MDESLYYWLRTAHMVGFILWVAGVIGVLALLDAHARIGASARDAMVGVERRTAMIMEIGSLLAIGAGLYLAFKSPRFPTHAFADGGWLHVKLTLVVLALIGAHVFARIRLRKFRNGEIKALPGWLLPVVILAVIGIVSLAANYQLLRK